MNQLIAIKPETITVLLRQIPGLMHLRQVVLHVLQTAIALVENSVTKLKAVQMIKGPVMSVVMILPT